VTLPGDDPFVALFSESSARVVVSVSSAHEEEFVALCVNSGLPQQRIGRTDVLVTELAFTDLFSVALDELRERFTSTLPALFG
jgi:hypothetical protein